MNDYFKHESAYVDEGCVIGKGTKIWHFSCTPKGVNTIINHKIID